MFELWVCVVGGEDDDERIAYKGNRFNEVENAVLKHNDEVITDCDKYFLLNTNNGSYDFYSHNDFCDLVFRGIIR